MLSRLKQIRNFLEYNQTEFAKQMGLTQTAYSMIEIGKRQLSEKHIKLISSAYGVNEHWLKTGEGEMFQQSPYEKEFMDIFDRLTPATQEYLLAMAKGLLETQEKLLEKRGNRLNQEH